jgi:hypothetical protein
MLIPVSCGRLRFEGGSCFLEHRSTNNHLMRTRLVRALSDDSAGTSPQAVSLLQELGLADGDQVFIDGFLVGEQPELELAVRGATAAPTHRGTLIFEGSRSLLRKPVGTRLLRRFGDEATATEMLRNCGKQNGDPIEVTGTETVSSSGIPIIEIDSIQGC